MRFKVPQNVDIEDRIVGPLTGKQFLWFVGAAAVLFIIYRFVDISLFLSIAVIVVGLAAALAFFRPYNQSLIVFLGHMLLFGTKSRQYIWVRKKEQFKPFKPEESKEDKPLTIRKKLPEKKIEQLAQILDTEGKQNFFKEPASAAKAQAGPVDSIASPKENSKDTEEIRKARLRNQSRAQELSSNVGAKEQLTIATASGLPSQSDVIPTTDSTPSPDSPNFKNPV